MFAKVDQIEPFYTKSLPLVESVFDQFNDISFEKTCIIGAQHLLPTTLQMLYSFFLRGLNPANVFLIGKCYSTDFLTYHRMSTLGIKTCPSSYFFKQGKSFDKVYQNSIVNFILSAKNQIQKFKTIIILDDGGTLIKKVTELLDSTQCKIIGIEQTTAGYEILKRFNLKFPVINVARSKAKLQYESPIVALTIAEQLYSKCSEIDFQNKKKMLIAGNGAIGQAVFRLFKDEFEINCFDINPYKSSIEYSNLKNELSKFDLIVGCTGKTFLNYSDLKYLKNGTVLISASSSDREFSAYELQKRYKGHLDCHDDFEINGIKIVNCGFPVNFGKDAFITDPPFFQFTRALLTAAILTGLSNEYSNNIITLEENMQEFIIKTFFDRVGGSS